MTATTFATCATIVVRRVSKEQSATLFSNCMHVINLLGRELGVSQEQPDHPVDPKHHEDRDEAREVDAAQVRVRKVVHEYKSRSKAAAGCSERGS